MKNLAGNPKCDSDIRTELQSAGIVVVSHPAPLRNEVPASLTGKLTRTGLEAFTFTRAWYYWVVKGNVPLAVANEIFENATGKADVRARGDAGCPAPQEVVTWLTPDGKTLLPFSEKEIADRMVKDGHYTQDEIDSKFHFADPASYPNFGSPFITGYHIDSQEGLELFVNTLRKHGLAD